MKASALIALVVMTAPLAMASPRVLIAHFAHSGSGCPQGSAQVSLAPDAKHIQVFFDHFRVEADMQLDQRAPSKSCELNMRIKVPHGFSLALERVKMAGLIHLPYGSQTQISGDFFVNHEELTSISKRYFGNNKSALEITSRMPQHALSWTPCGEDVVIRGKAKVAVSAAKSFHPAYAQLDDLDEKAGLRFELLWRTCKEPLL